MLIIIVQCFVKYILMQKIINKKIFKLLNVSLSKTLSNYTLGTINEAQKTFNWNVSTCWVKFVFISMKSKQPVLCVSFQISRKFVCNRKFSKVCSSKMKQNLRGFIKSNCDESATHDKDTIKAHSRSFDVVLMLNRICVIHQRSGFPALCKICVNID